MPILKTITLPCAVDSSYWKISRIILAIEEKQLIVHMGGFVSKTAQQNGATPIIEYKIEIYGNDLEPILDNTTGLKASIGNLINLLEPIVIARLPQISDGTIE